MVKCFDLLAAAPPPMSELFDPPGNRHYNGDEEEEEEEREEERDIKKEKKGGYRLKRRNIRGIDENKKSVIEVEINCSRCVLQRKLIKRKLVNI